MYNNNDLHEVIATLKHKQIYHNIFDALSSVGIVS
jgi:hypothetical protein